MKTPWDKQLFFSCFLLFFATQNNAGTYKYSLTFLLYKLVESNLQSSLVNVSFHWGRSDTKFKLWDLRSILRSGGIQVRKGSDGVNEWMNEYMQLLILVEHIFLACLYWFLKAWWRDGLNCPKGLGKYGRMVKPSCWPKCWFWSIQASRRVSRALGERVLGPRVTMLNFLE